MWGLVSNFTGVDWKDPLEISYFFVCVTFCVVCLLANRVNLPFLHRQGGLLTYSKFAADVKFGVDISSQWGMALLYWPSMLLGAYFLSQSRGNNNISAEGSSQDPSARRAALMILHFGKRTAECLFLHKYSGTMPLSSSMFITCFYLFTTFGVCFFSAKQDLASFTDVGLTLFYLGQTGNYYHHSLLANLRKQGDKEYKVPTGGLFEYVAAPHYLFEIISWVGVSLVCQHVLVALAVLGMTIYLSDRAIGQSKWNRENLKDKYPAHRKHLVPFLF